MKHAIAYLLCLLILFLPGCAMLSPEQQSAARATLDHELAAGRITPAQHEAAVEALAAPVSAIDWNELLVTGGSVVASVLLGVPIAVGAVQRKRGPTEAQRAAARAHASSQST